MKPTVALTFSLDVQRQVISPELRAQMRDAFTLLSPEAEGKVTPEQAAQLLRNADGCMTGWGSPCLSAEVLAGAPRLRIVAHSAGSVKAFVSPALFERGIVVTSAAAQIAIDVAHATLALIIIGRKNIMELAPIVKSGQWSNPEGIHRKADDPRGCTVGVIAASHVGRHVLKLLPHFDIKALLYDPFVSAEQARALNAEKVELDELFQRSDVVSCHAPSIPATKHMVNAQRLAMMKDGATFINTARGSCVDEQALVQELSKKRIWAFLDVTDPEPPPPGSPLYTCPNLTLTPHITGSIGRARLYLGAQAFRELQAFFAGKPVQYQVQQEMLERMG
ncbi:MAG TPA: hydroxyacid dehydrogenase [Planctomycetota bacterium]|jgi:phosphoglycerate dehydrogenase-like enzyme